MSGAASPRAEDAGVILVNVLVTLALASALLVLMLTSQDSLLDRARRVSAAAQAEALALGGETSVLVALRRDMDAAPEVDHYAEPWALAQQQEVTLDTGRFAVVVRDAQARLDVNALAGGGVLQQQLLARLVAELDLPAEVAARIVVGLRDGPVSDLSEIAGLDDRVLAALAPHLTALPVPGSVNLNTADPLLLGVLLQNRAAARKLVAIRDRAGLITPADLRDAGVVGAGGYGFKSDVYDVTVTAEVDGMEVVLNSRLLRRSGVGTRDVVVLRRGFGAGSGPPDDPDRS